MCDNLNTHTLASFYQAFEPQKAQRILQTLRLVHTPKHGSWLNMAEPELSVLTRECLSRSIIHLDDINQETQQWLNTVHGKARSWALRRYRMRPSSGIY